MANVKARRPIRIPRERKEPLAERLVMGVEIESYTIVLPEYRISRELAFPRKGVAEKGESFKRDWSIGTEYNSRPFKTIREGLFLLKAGLRKYSLKLYRSRSRSRKGRQLFLVGGWRDRFAGAHIHLSIASEKLHRKDAKHLAGHIHDHLPLLIAIGGNSPVWADELSDISSTRIVRASQIYFRPITRHTLTSRSLDEMLFNKSRVTKPATLEIRILDANLPEYVMCAASLVKAIYLAWASGKKAPNRLPQRAYLKSREQAALKGMKAKLYWNGKWITATEYLDRFFWVYRDEFALMDIPEEVWTTFRLLKRGYNGSRILSAAAKRAYLEHPQTWQRRFAKRYVSAIDRCFSGDSILAFMKQLHIEAPQINDVWLGRKRMRLS